MDEVRTQRCCAPNRHRRFLTGLGRFRRDPSGASALEFALIAFPLILLLLAALEVGIVYFANFSLENATAQGARLIRTGQAQAQKFDAGKFTSQVCKHFNAPISCTGLRLDVRRFANFSGASLTSPLDGNGNLKTSFAYEPGQGSEVVIVRAFYEWGLIAKFPKQIGLSNMANGNRLLAATAAFRNEPFK
jgi:Flp pilus assembly protein TadG